MGPTAIVNDENGERRERGPISLYRAVMLEFERRRAQLGISMERLSEIAGIADRAYSKLLYPDAANGRIGSWQSLQIVADVLWADGFDISIRARSGYRLSKLSQKYLIRTAQIFGNERHRREFMREAGAKGGRARAANLTNAAMSKIGRLGHQARMRSVPPERRSEQARRAVLARWGRRQRGAS